MWLAKAYTQALNTELLYSTQGLKSSLLFHIIILGEFCFGGDSYIYSYDFVLIMEGEM